MQQSKGSAATKKVGNPHPDTIALVLQGGGALGSYQAGVIEELSKSGVNLDWVAGISIGAINSAIVAGNPPEKRVEQLHAFWSRVTSALPDFPLIPNDHIRAMVNQWSAGAVLMNGVPGFFHPRPVSPAFAPVGSPDALSFYDSSELVDTLNSLVDWDLLNDGPVRLSVGAVNVATGNFRYFDTTTDRIDARHIMASGALPPGLPPVEIDGELWWDGGLVSNTPLAHVLGNQQGSLLVFQVDLFSSRSDPPKTIADVMTREKEIRYSSRTRQVSDTWISLRKYRQLVDNLLDRLPDEVRNEPEVVELQKQCAGSPVSLVHLIYRANSWEGGARDFEFSSRTMHDHWQAGRIDVSETMASAHFMAENLADGKIAAFDLTQAKPSNSLSSKES